MFTGIITDVGRVRSVQQTDRDRRYEIETAYDLAGVDIGATHSRVALTTLAGRVLAERAAEIDINEGPERILGAVSARIEALCGTRVR